MKFDDIELTLLSEEEVWGVNGRRQLDVIKKYGTKAAITDLAILTGACVLDYHVDEDISLKGRTGWLWTRSSDGDGAVRGVNLAGSRYWYDRYKRTGVVRPALLSSSVFSQISPNRVRGDNGTEEVEYGEYPQYAADSRMQSILKSEYNRGMNKTGRSYTFDSVKYNDYDTGFKPVTYEEYEYQGKKYIRIRANSDFGGSEFKLSNGVEYTDGDYVWVEVSPVKWLIDDRTGILISKMGLVSGIRFLDKRTNYKGNFSKTEMKAYLNNYMVKDMFQSVKKDYTLSNNLNEKSQKISDISKEICDLINNYDDKDSIIKKVKSLIEEYNENLKNLPNNSGLILTTHSTDKNSLYLKLVGDLELILNRLKGKEEYFSMLDLVDGYIKALSSKETDTVSSDSKDDLKTDLVTLKSVVLPFLGDGNKEKELLDIFIEERNNINDYLRGNSDNSIKECSTVEEFKIRIRRKLHPFLIDINSNVRNKELVKEIRDGYLKVCSGLYKKEKDDYISRFLSEINSVVEDIKIRGNEIEKSKLDELLSEEMAYDDENLINLVEKIRELYIKLYGIVIDINERLNESKELEDYIVNVDGIFNK